MRRDKGEGDNSSWLAQSELNIRTDLRPDQTRPDQTRPDPDRDLLIYQLWPVLECRSYEETSSSIKIHIQSKIKVANSNQEPLASPKARNQDLKDMDLLCTFKIKI